MPRTRSLAWSELKIGVLTIVAIVVGAVTVFTVMGSRGFFWQRYTLKTRLPDVTGLKSGSPVRVSGMEVGSVNAVVFSGDQLDVVFEVNKEVRPRITEKSIATLGSVSLLGLGALDITAASGGAPIPDGGYVPTGKAAPSLSNVTSQASEGIGEITGLLKDMRAGKGTAGKFMTDDRLFTEMQAFVSSANDVTRTIRSGRGSVGRFINDPAIANSLQGSLNNLETMTRRINAGEGSLGKLVNDEAFAKSLTGATDNLRTLTDRLNRTDGSAGKFINDPALYNQLKSLADRLDSLTKSLNDGQGTAGAFLKDRKLYENINAAVNDVRDLVAAIKKDPKKYLNVRVSIF